MTRNFVHLFQKFVHNPKLKQGFGEQFIKNLTLTHQHQHDHHRVLYLYKVSHDNINIQGTVHGGALCSLIDITTTISMLKFTSSRTTSISLSTQFLRPSKLHDELRIQTYIKKAGKNIIFSDCQIYLGKQLTCKGTHIKAVMSGDWDFIGQ